MSFNFKKPYIILDNNNPKRKNKYYICQSQIGNS